jgi:TolB-like protein/Flp pilus assembly protein TadD
MRLKQKVVHLELLGGFRLLRTGGVPVAINGKKAQALLAYLALQNGKPVSREKASRLLWNGLDDEHGRNNLRQCLVGLRRDLAGISELLRVERDQLSLNLASVTTDVLAIRNALNQPSPVEWSKALDSYGGSFLDGVTLDSNEFEDWTRDIRDELVHAAINLHERLLAQEAGQDRVQRARQLLALDRLRESSQQILIQALADQGQIEAAIKQYHLYGDLLKTELNLEPSSQLTKLFVNLAEKQKQGVPRQTPDLARSLQDAQMTRMIDPARCSIAILPFNNMTGDAQQDCFVDGLVEDILTELARFRHFAMISRNASFAYRNKLVDAQTIGRELGADFILEGSARRSGNRLHVATQLIDCATGLHVWAERFDGNFEDIAAVHDEMVLAITGGLSFGIAEVAAHQRARDPSVSDNAYTAYLQARAAWQAGDEHRVQEHLRRAIELSPNYGQALSFLACSYAWSRLTFSSGLNDADAAAAARKYSRKAIDADKYNPMVLLDLAEVYLMLGEPRVARNYIESAVTLLPRDTAVMHTHGTILVFCGEHQKGLALMELVHRLERRKSVGLRVALTYGYYLARDYATAVKVYDTILEMPAYVRLLRAISIAQMDHKRKAREEVALATSDAPTGFDPKILAKNVASMCAFKEDALHWLDGFRKAGVEVG